MDKVGEYTLEIMREAAWYNDWLFRKTEEHIKGDILEVGAGIGNFTTSLASKGKVTAIDLNRSYITKLGKKLGKTVSIGFGDIETGKYFFSGKKFDTLICLNVLEHIGNDTIALENMYNLLKDKGNLILLVPAHKLLYSKFDSQLGHFRRYNVADMKTLLEKAGFANINIKYINWWAAVGWLVFLKLLKNKRLPKNEVGIFNLLGKMFLWPENYIAPPFGLSVLAIAQK